VTANKCVLNWVSVYSAIVRCKCVLNLVSVYSAIVRCKVWARETSLVVLYNKYFDNIVQNLSVFCFYLFAVSPLLCIIFLESTIATLYVQQEVCGSNSSLIESCTWSTPTICAGNWATLMLYQGEAINQRFHLFLCIYIFFKKWHPHKT